MLRTLDDLEADGAALGVRVDINSPLAEGALADDARLRAHVDTVDELCRRDGRVALLAHQGRPGGVRGEVGKLVAARTTLVGQQGDPTVAPAQFVDGVDVGPESCVVRQRPLREGTVDVDAHSERRPLGL